MNDISRFELELMARAREAIEPTASDRVRLREQLTAKFALLSAAAAIPSVPVAKVHPLRHLLNSHLVALWAAALVAGTASFGAGYYKGYRARPLITKTVAVTIPSSKDPSTSIPPPVPADIKLDPSSLASSSEWGHSGTRPKVTASAAPSANTVDNSLSEELDLLRRAERTIRAGNPLVALGLLRDLDQRFPKGQLLEERTAARVMANCQLADTDTARARGNAYLIAHPQSVYADRVRSICQLDGAKVTKDLPADIPSNRVSSQRWVP